MVHRRAFEVTPVSEDLLGHLAPQQLEPQAPPAPGGVALEAAAAERERHRVLEQVVAEQVPLQVPTEPLRLEPDRAPEPGLELRLGRRPLALTPEEVAAPVEQPERGRIRLPAHRSSAQAVAPDPVDREVSRVGELERPE